MNYLFLLDTRDNQYYSLERLPAIKRAMAGSDSVYIDIYGLCDHFDASNILCLNKGIIDYIQDSDFDVFFTAIEVFNYLLPQTVLEIRKLGVKTVCVLGDDELNFDYTLKEGICKNMNASFLLKKMEIV